MSYKSLELTNPVPTSQQFVATNHMYLGFSTVDNTNPGSKLYDVELIKRDLINHFNTRKGSRVMNPTFGTLLWDYLMEPLTDNTRTLLQAEVTSICSADPRIYPTIINLTEYTDGYLLELTVNIVKTNQSTNILLRFDQNLGLASSVQQ
jgi:phage baseplate assembly protein W